MKIDHKTVIDIINGKISILKDGLDKLTALDSLVGEDSTGVAKDKIIFTILSLQEIQQSILDILTETSEVPDVQR